MKRLFGLFICAALIVSCLPTVTRAVGTSASSAILMEAESGRVLYAQNIHDRRLIASTTKLMTALVAAEWCGDLNEVVTIGAESCGIEGSSVYLQPGEKITLEALLYGLLLRSGNDAAVAVALHCAPSVEAFVERMNEKARALGMENSHFSNPNGLDADDHYSTAYDMALLARACLDNELVAQIAAARQAEFDGRFFKNHNKLLWQYEGCIGMKTGFTEKAGRTLVSAAQRGGMTLIAVTLNDPDDWRDHTALFDYGFSHYAPVHLIKAGQQVVKIPVSGTLVPFVNGVAREEILFPVAQGELVDYRIELNSQRLAAPVCRGDLLGRLVLILDGEEVAAVELLALEAAADLTAPKPGLWERLRSLF